jgi:phospholipid/cholesterol/gamma-HCH transport system substrate-binding protein
VILFGCVIFLISSQHGAFSRHFAVFTEFADLNGLTKGAKVQVAGLSAGEITDISIPKTPGTPFRIRLRIDNQFHPLVRTDSFVTIATQGVVGDKFLLIHPGTARAAEASAGSTLPGKDTVSMDELMANGADLLSEAKSTMAETRQKVDKTLDVAATTATNANDVIVGVKEGKGTVGMLLRDQATASRIRQSIQNAHDASESLNHASQQTGQIVTDIQSRNLGQKADEAASNAQSATQNLKASSEQIRGTVSATLGPNEQGVDAATSVRQSLGNVNQATENMADDTEALKRNFFLRGFFKKRGYYNLAHIPPDQYRKSKVFANSQNRREWLQAGDLFAAGPKGDEVLTASGKAQIDSAVAQWRDFLGGPPLIIEGYSAASDPADRFANSRHRAAVVRDYVRRRFHLDPQNVAVEALGDQPPAGVGRDKWNGICLVLLAASQGGG